MLESIRKRLTAAVEKRDKVMPSSDAVRMVNGLGDGLPGLILDRYGNHFQLQIYQARWLEHVSWLGEWVFENWSPDFLIAKLRTSADGRSLDLPEMRVLHEGKGSVTQVSEGKARFLVDLADTVNPGLFLDMRANRLRFAKECGKGELLNLFAYTCAFGVHARLEGARVVNVDISAKALGKGRRNLELNGLKPAVGELKRMDSLAYLDWAERKGRLFDAIVVDPPSFARDKGKVFRVGRALPLLIAKSLRCLRERGGLLLATNCSGIDSAYLERALQQALLDEARQVSSLEHWGQDWDFMGSGASRESHLAALFVRLR